MIDEGAIASSSVTRRAWGEGLHHLIDPSTGRPAQGDVLQSTVWAPTCAEAEVRAKEALLDGEPYLDRGAGLLVLRDGSVLTNLTMSGAAPTADEVAPVGDLAARRSRRRKEVVA